MSIPLYLALNQKESVDSDYPTPAQYGYGFCSDGTPRLPKNPIPDALALIDDAVLPEKAPSAAALEALAACCRNGCLLDFERRRRPAHTSILLALAALVPETVLFAAPERFCGLCRRATPLITTPRQCPSWVDFVRAAQRRCPEGWMLEIIPCAYTAQMPFSKAASGFLQSSLCCYRQSGQLIRYYDTGQTIRKKLDIAQQHGCRAAIGLYRELSPLLPAREDA